MKSLSLIDSFADGAAPGESTGGARRLVIAAFLSLFGTLASQALLETARDALVLTHLPMGQLPWLYLIMALLTLVVGGVQTRMRRGSSSRAVSAVLLTGAGLTAGLGVALGGSGTIALYGLFLWSGIFAALSVGEIWTVVAETMDISFAKRLYGRLAAGGGLGAVAGAAMARLLSTRVEPRHLVFVAATLAAATALGPALLLRGTSARRAPRTTVGGGGGRAVATGPLAGVLHHPYLVRLLALALLAAAISTLLDFSFKEAVVTHLSTAQLPRFFATFHLATSLTALLLQVFGVAVMVRTVGVGRVQVWLAALLLLGVLATLLSGGLAAVLLLRGGETALRGAFQRPTSELLQLPLSDRLRRKARPFIDAFGQRAGQALAGLMLLLMFRLAGTAPVTRLIVVAALLILWLMLALGLGRRYVDLLRATLLHPRVPASVDTRSYADGAGRATLVAALQSPNALEVRAAVDLLFAYGQAQLIPLRLLRHPAPAVVLRAVETVALEAHGRATTDLLAALDELLDHPDLSVRQAALRRRSALAPDRALLTRLSTDERCPTLRALSLVILMDRGWAGPERGLPELCALVANGDLALRLAIAEALADRPSWRFDEVFLRLADAQEPEVLTKVATILGATGGPAAIETLMALLGKRDARGPARAALTRLGAPAFERAAAVLADREQPQSVRGNLPRALVELDPERAVGALMEGLLVEDDGFVRFRILRALNRLRRLRPKATLDEDILGRAAVAATDSAYRYLGWRIFLEDGADRLPVRRTRTWVLLRELLVEKERNAVERLFRVLTLRYPRENFRKLLRALRMGGRRTRAAGRELIENLLTGPAQTLTLALIDDSGDRKRFSALARGNADARPQRAPTYAELLTAIGLEEEGGTLAALANHHAAELTVRVKAAGATGAAAAARAASGIPAIEIGSVLVAHAR